jgi:acetyl esterase/lipase
MAEVIELWPDGAPLAQGDAPEDRPGLTPFPADAGRATGAAVVVCPGGGYQKLAPHEGAPVAEWLNTLGVSAFVLSYRIAPRYGHPAPLLDAARAVRTLRHRAGEWGLRPDAIGILGFSAGGHLASSLGTHFDGGAPVSGDPVERVSSRPDFMVLVYPVISFREFGHVGSRRNLLGDNPSDDLVDLFTNHRQVTPSTPPTFLVHTTGDAGVPIENSVMFAQALRACGVPFELHVLEGGRHGFGLGGDDPVCASWPGICATWLRQRGLARR